MLQNRSILITGGGSGIGEALALQLAKENKVLICGRTEENLKKVGSQNENITYEVVDISDFQSIDNFFIKIKESGILLDVLINNAGITELWDLKKTILTSEKIFEKVNTNFAGAVAMVQHFINQADGSKSNLIINNTSEVAIMPIPILPLYSASKAGLSTFTRSLRIQLRNTNFKVIELLPPGTDTNMPKQLGNKGKLISASDFAQKAITAINKGRTEFTYGPTVYLFKIFSRVAPKQGLTLIDKLSRKQLAGN